VRRIRIRLVLLAAWAIWAGSGTAAEPPSPPVAGAAGPEEGHAGGEGAEGHEGHHEGHEGEDHEKEPSDLSLCDFFTAGWDEPFEERPREGRAPRFNLFKSRQGFLERIGFLGYSYTNGLDGGQNEHELSGGVEWAFNRRFQVGVESFYTWQRPSSADSRRGDGLRWEFSTRFQLIDTADRAYNFQIHVVTPDSTLDAPQTELAFTLAGFEDLTKTLGLRRVGVYYDVEYVSLIGPRGLTPSAGGDDSSPDGAGRRPGSLFRYDVSVAKTFVDPTVPLIGDFTAFVETFAETQLDGSRSGNTLVSFTPGVRFNPTGREEKAWWVQAGVEFPVSGPRPFNERVLLEIIHDF
jgi:hypothetical protein